jgi:hypothetical protein
LTTAKCAAHPH